MRSQLRQFTFPKLRKALQQFFARHQRQHRIPQKLQLLVVADLVLALARLLRFLLPRLRTVRDRLFNDGSPAEMVAQPFFQRRDFTFFHMWAYVGTAYVGTAASGCPESAARRIFLLTLRFNSSAVPPSFPAPCRHSASSAG